MHALFACGHIAARGRALQRGFAQGRIHDGVPVGLQGRHLGAQARLLRALLVGAGRPELLGVGEQMVDRALRTHFGFGRAVAHAHQPVARMAQVVARFFQRLGGNGGQLAVAGALQAIPQQHHEGAVEKVAHDGGGKVAVAGGGGQQGAAVRQLQQGVVQKIRHIAKVGQRIFGSAVAQQLGGALVQQARLTDQVQAVVGQGNVFFQNRTVATPFGIALSQDQGVVGQVQ